MAFDVLLVSAIGDRDKATIIARRLRALKFRVRHDANRTHKTPSARDLSDCNKAVSVLVLWSKHSCDTSKPDSDWVHAMAHLARSRGDALVQADLDGRLPDDPFDKDDRFDLSGLTARSTPEPFRELVETLGEKEGRSDLGDWMALKASDEAGKAAWREAHPNDPLSQTGRANRAAATAAVASAAATAQIADASAGHKIELNPPRPEVEFADNMSGRGGTSLFMLGSTGLVVAGMLVLAGLFGTSPVQAGSSVAQAGIRNVVEACPAGQVPRSLIHGSLLADEEAGAGENETGGSD